MKNRKKNLWNATWFHSDASETAATFFNPWLRVPRSISSFSTADSRSTAHRFGTDAVTATCHADGNSSAHLLCPAELCYAVMLLVEAHTKDEYGSMLNRRANVSFPIPTGRAFDCVSLPWLPLPSHRTCTKSFFIASIWWQIISRSGDENSPRNCWLCAAEVSYCSHTAGGVGCWLHWS